ncbi:MAG: hypothetical protein RL664_1415, partial [Bacteroidota bacterium]
MQHFWIVTTRVLIFSLCFGLFPAICFAQPANDNCSNAIYLGALPAPSSCPIGVGNTVTLNGTNINATDNYPNYLADCTTGGDQPSYAPDVWYSFVSTGTGVNINITPGINSPVLSSPAITLWEGTNCNSLDGVDCDNNGTPLGNNSASFSPLVIGTMYYIQISGMNYNSMGNFTLSINATINCSPCLQTSTLTVTPLPTLGTYPPNTTVNFCYTITSFNQNNLNWLHGVIPAFGNGWNLSTLTNTPSPQCNANPPGQGNLANGTWSWYNSITSNASGQTFGPGFFFEYAGDTDNNPGNNYGDYTAGTCTWTFCWSIKTKANCGGGTNLSVSINTTADGESGSWISPACSIDPEYQFTATLNCCSTPTINATNVSCNGTNTGSITATPNSGTSPWDFVWTNASGAVIGTTLNAASNTINNLTAGLYNLAVTDNVGCVSSVQTIINQPTALTANSSATSILCSGGQATVSVTATGGTAPYSGTGNFSVPAGNQNYNVTDANGCSASTSVVVAQPPSLDWANTQWPPSGQICFGESFIVYGQVYEPGITSGAGAQGAGISVQVGVFTSNTNPASWPSTAWSAANFNAFGGGNNNDEYMANIGSSLAAGTYYYAFRYSLNGCPFIYGGYSRNTNVNGQLIVRQVLPTATLNSPILCFGNSTTVSVTANGGTGPYIGTGTFAVTAGNYSYNVTDVNGCTATTSITVTQPTVVSASATATAIACNGGSATVSITANGGTGPYIGTGSFTVNAGNYSYNVTDVNGC